MKVNLFFPKNSNKFTKNAKNEYIHSNGTSNVDSQPKFWKTQIAALERYESLTWRPLSGKRDSENRDRLLKLLLRMLPGCDSKIWKAAFVFPFCIEMDSTKRSGAKCFYQSQNSKTAFFACVYRLSPTFTQTAWKHA